MTMTKEEICRDYKLAAKKANQIKVLADLNQCTKKEIAEILMEGGLDVPKWYKPNEEKKDGVQEIRTRRIMTEENDLLFEIDANGIITQPEELAGLTVKQAAEKVKKALKGLKDKEDLMAELDAARRKMEELEARDKELIEKTGDMAFDLVRMEQTIAKMAMAMFWNGGENK